MVYYISDKMNVPCTANFSNGNILKLVHEKRRLITEIRNKQSNAEKQKIRASGNNG